MPSIFLQQERSDLVDIDINLTAGTMAIADDEAGPSTGGGTTARVPSSTDDRTTDKDNTNSTIIIDTNFYYNNINSRQEGTMRRNDQDVPSAKEKKTSSIMVPSMKTMYRKQQNLLTSNLHLTRGRTLLVALLLFSMMMMMLLPLLLTCTSDATGATGISADTGADVVELSTSNLILLPQLDTVPTYVHRPHSGVLFVSAFNLPSSRSSSSSLSRGTSRNTLQPLLTDRGWTMKSTNHRSNYRSRSCSARPIDDRISTTRRTITRCSSSSPFLSSRDQNQRRYRLSRPQPNHPRHVYTPVSLMSTASDDDDVEYHDNNDDAVGGSDNRIEESSSIGPSSSSRSRSDVTPARRALVNMLIMMTSPFPEIRSALKIRPKRRRRRRTTKTQTTTRNGRGYDAVQTGSGSTSSSSAVSSSTTTPRPSFIERYWKPLAGLLYVCLGVLVYDVLLEKQQHWSMVDAIYFAMTCFTTVGYGDLVPSTYLGKFFTCLYGFTGIALLGALVASIGSKLFHLELDAVNNVKKQSQQQVLRFYDKMPHVLERYKKHQKQKKEQKKQQRQEQQKVKKSKQTNQLSSDVHDDDHQQNEIEAKSESRRLFRQAQCRKIQSVWKTLKFVGSPLAVILSSGIIMGKIEKWNVLDSFYYALVTGTTIGLGDFSPQTRIGKMVAIILIPVLVGATGEILAGIGVALLRRRQRKIFDEQANGSFTIEDIEKMDENHNGQVSKYEYTLYMLLQMDLITKDEVDDLYEQFNRLDVTESGYIDSEDLKVMAKLRQEREQQQQQQ